MTPRASEFAVAVVDLLRDAQGELRATGEFEQLLEFVSSALARIISESWDQAPDRPEGWSA
jgi:hypothetical protein